MSEQALCLGPCRPTDHGGPRQAMPGLALCDICEDRAAEDLHWIAGAWSDAQERLGIEGRSQEVKAPSPDRGLVLNEKASEALGQVRSDLWFWTKLILDENPGFKGPRSQTPDGLARYVATHIKSLTRHSDPMLASGVAIDIRAHRRAIRKVAYPSGARLFTPTPEIACFEHATSDQGERIPCPGHYQVFITDRIDSLPDLSCSEDDTHILEPMSWKRAGRMAMNPTAVENLVRSIATRVTPA